MNDRAIAQLVTRIPARVRKAVRIRCVERERTIESFVQEAIEEALARAPKDRR